MDKNINTFRIGIRINKWWWALVAFIPDRVVQNAWVLYRLSAKNQYQPMDLLDFRREICAEYRLLSGKTGATTTLRQITHREGVPFVAESQPGSA
ncbi:hypothetical protein DPMN_067826 [Dreissena polymorpha]|uniref:Uncharacterized protein n=1 Tax=Dreissena polymorpha TaxID=45954 RepID=A0A9D4BTV0_DREPO|nr:hypothetical protein DPMN_067826 [Dreissena polymorpha]